MVLYIFNTTFEASNIVAAVVSLGGIGAAFGFLLGVCAKYFAVEKDSRIDAITEVLPSANCGGCGYAGCAAYATAIVQDGASLTLCNVGGQQCVDEISGIMQVSLQKMSRMTARVRCVGTYKIAVNKYVYDGQPDCVSASRLAGGHKACEYGCMGFGTCAEVCQFGAITIQDGVAVVDESKCTACGKCVQECPKHIISLVPFDSTVYVACANTQRGAVVKNECSTGCIGCRLCVKACPSDAIKVENFLASIDPEKCTSCRKCVEVCPKRVIKLQKLPK